MIILNDNTVIRLFDQNVEIEQTSAGLTSTVDIYVPEIPTLIERLTDIGKDYEDRVDTIKYIPVTTKWYDVNEELPVYDNHNDSAWYLVNLQVKYSNVKVKNEITIARWSYDNTWLSREFYNLDSSSSGQKVTHWSVYETPFKDLK